MGTGALDPFVLVEPGEPWGLALYGKLRGDDRGPADLNQVGASLRLAPTISSSDVLPCDEGKYCDAERQNSQDDARDCQS